MRGAQQGRSHKVPAAFPWRAAVGEPHKDPLHSELADTRPQDVDKRALNEGSAVENLGNTAASDCFHKGQKEESLPWAEVLAEYTPLEVRLEDNNRRKEVAAVEQRAVRLSTSFQISNRLQKRNRTALQP